MVRKQEEEIFSEVLNLNVSKTTNVTNIIAKMI